MLKRIKTTTTITIKYRLEKIESLNFRCNKNFNDNIVKALAEGINLKKELRVSKKIYLYFFRQ